MDLPFSVLLILGAGAAAFAATGLLLSWLKARTILDHPNERSSHAAPTPKGGGIAVIAVLLGVWVVIAMDRGAGPVATWAVPAIAFILACISWIDDLRGLSPLARLTAQAGAVATTLAFVPGPVVFFGGLLPPVADTVAAGLLWVWFINLYNFMDGVDAITGVETATIGLGIALIAFLAGLEPGFILYGLSAAAVAIGFLAWNRPPAKIFLGDVGSVPLGYLMGLVLLALSAEGQGPSALIVSLYYLTDATVTLFRRALRGEKVWQAHHQHFYQRGLERGLDHGAVTRAIARANILLVALAGVAAMGRIFPAFVGAGITVLFLLAYLSGWAGTQGRDKPPA